MKFLEKNPIWAERMQHLKNAKSLPLKKRIVYYLDFYKGPAIGALLVLALLVYIVKLIFFTNPVILDGSFLNAYQEPSLTEEEFMTGYMNYAGLDPKKNDYFFTFSDPYLPDDVATSQKLMVSIAAGELDFYICNKNDMLNLANLGYLDDPSILLTDNLKSKYSEDFYYFDYTKNNIEDDDEFGNIPVAVKITDSRIIDECGAFGDQKDLYFCFVVNSKQVEHTVSFFQWIMEAEHINP